MDEEKRPSALRDALLTILAVWAALILAGFAGVRLQPSIAGASVSLAVYLVLLFAWGLWAAPGRRTHLAVHLLAGLLYWLLCIALFLAMPTAMMMGSLQWISVGTTVGYLPEGNMHNLGSYLVPMMLNQFGPIVLMGLLRGWMRGDWAR